MIYKNLKNNLIAAGICSTFIFAMSAAAQTKDAATNNTMMNQSMNMDKTHGGMMMDEAMMNKMKEFSTPNENHKVLDQLVGQWNLTMKWWMSADATPEQSTGSSETAWILGGRFIEEKVSGQAMNQPFEGRGITGYDNLKKEYQSVWLDNMSTGMMTSTGSYDAATKTLTQNGSFSCPIVNGPRNFRGIIKVVDGNNYMYTMYMTDPNGKEFKSMEINYTRKK